MSKLDITLAGETVSKVTGGDFQNTTFRANSVKNIVHKITCDVANATYSHGDIIVGNASAIISDFGRMEDINSDADGKVTNAPIINSVTMFTNLPVTGPVDIHFWGSSIGFGNAGSAPSCTGMAVSKVYNGSITLDDWKDFGGSPTIKACTLSNIGLVIDLLSTQNSLTLQVVNQTGQNVVASGSMQAYLKLGVIND